MDEEDWLESYPENPNKTKATPEFWKEIESHPAFATEIDFSKELPPDIAAMQALKFECEDPLENAKSYKEEGNVHYKDKKFKLAIENYSKAISLKPDDKELMSVLHTNKGICNYYLGNYGTCIKDCRIALQYNPEYLKPCLRGALASDKLKRPDICLEFCVAGLKIDAQNTELLNLQKKMLRSQMDKHKEQLNRTTEQIKLSAKEEELRRVIKSRGIKIGKPKNRSQSEMPDQFKNASYVDSDQNIHFPIVLLYPEFDQLDLLQDNVETVTLENVLSVVFNLNDAPPSWDPDRKYQVDTLHVYFIDCDEKYHRIKRKKSLCDALKNSDFSISPDLVLTFCVLSTRSPKFYETWKERNQIDIVQ